MGCLIKIIKNFVKISIVIVLILLLNGFLLYRNAVSKISVEQKVSEITSKSNYVEIQDISEYLKDYIVQVEDKRFYTHSGIDVIAILGSMIENLGAGYYKYGGSTITQQLAKNMYFTNEKKITRKIAEMFVSFKLEREYSKDKILELYLNMIYFGNGYYGIKEASYGYFNVSPKNLNKYQSSLLAGIPQAPSVYNLKNKESKAMKKRYFGVLNRLVDSGRISPDEREEFKRMYLVP